MAKVDQYREYIQRLLTEYSNYKAANEEVEAQTIFDREHDHYQLVHVGWRNKRRIYGCVLHLDIKDDKIWIQHDGTEIGIASQLEALGVPKHDLVLGFHAPYKRKYTDYAVG
ncbi:XisI protein [Iningainema tapete]|uniref:XisI protein n=1 Tax=Iningainema tapete BLCC-T55 TaxID=2748662 RepID=A0A8J7BYE9_9CYAN|nr:XisI protein [Iningainema tapete]MBD2775622.1 XisI protein [Iningainema tapete BLCC-T55]